MTPGYSNSPKKGIESDGCKPMKPRVNTTGGNKDKALVTAIL